MQRYYIVFDILFLEYNPLLYLINVYNRVSNGEMSAQTYLPNHLNSNEILVDLILSDGFNANLSRLSLLR